MSERNPRYPAAPLRDALASVEKIYKDAGRSALDPEALVKILGYNGLNGASRSVLAALNGYGVITKEGNGYKVSEEAIGAIRPMDEADRLRHIRQMALAPSLFSEINTSHKDCTEAVLTTVLVRKGFSDDGARKAAKIWKDNFELARLGESGYVEAKSPAKPENCEPDGPKENEKPSKIVKNNNVLAQYSIPIGASEATITFTGERLTTEDFDALADYVAIFKKQFERKQKSEGHQKHSPEPPFIATWKNKDFDKIVKIVGFMGDKDGKKFYKSEDGTGIPASELFPNLQ